MINHNSKIFIAGHKGLVGSAILRKLISCGYNNLLTVDKKKLDLTNQEKVFNFLKKNKPKFTLQVIKVLLEVQFLESLKKKDIKI